MPEGDTAPFKVLSQGFCHLRFIAPNEEPDASLHKVDSSIIADSVFFENSDEDLTCSPAFMTQRDAEHLAYQVSRETINSNIQMLIRDNPN